MSRCKTFSGLVLKTKIDSQAIRTDPEVLKFALNETPSTLIVQALNSGKADFYYKKVRDTIKQLDFYDAFENLTTAIKFRNDFETEIFKKYFIVSASRLASFKNLFTNSARKVAELNSENIDLQYEISVLSDNRDHLEAKLKEQTKTSNILIDFTKELEKTNEKCKIEKSLILSTTSNKNQLSLLLIRYNQ